MTNVVLPNLNQTGANEWADVQGNDEAIKKVVNGELDNNNLKAGAGIVGTKLAEKTLEDKRLVNPVIVGSISATGAVEAGTGFTAEKTGTGIYKITLSTELATNGVMTATPVIGGVSIILVTGKSKKVFEVNTRKSAEALENSAFNFSIKAS